MEAEDVLGIYNLLEREGIKIIIDGGWCTDALLGKQTREHNDLDIAVEWKDVSKLRELLSMKGYQQIREDSKWNFVLRDDKDHEIDVHAFVLNVQGEVVDGIMYPAESLKGEGMINGQSVRCLTPQFQIKSIGKWVDKWPEKYKEAVAALCEKYDIERF